MTNVDPFADAIENDLPEDAPVNDDKPTTEQSVSADGLLTTTIKYGSGYDAPWDVIRTNSPAEADAILRSADFKDHMATMMTLWGWMREQAEKIAPTKNGSQGASQGRPQSSQDLPPGVPAENCQHGQRVYKAKGTWAALFCAAPQGTPDNQKCPPLWKQKDGTFKAK